MADKKISELTTASEIKNGDNLELSQDTGSGLVSLKATILAIANKMLNGINFTSDLQTTDKTVIGAINEVAQGGGGGASTEIIADDFDATSTYAVGDYVVYDDKLYKCTTAVSTAGQWDANDWTETIVMDEVGQGGGGTGGHTIIDENGTSMTARAGLQFVGANVDDDATNNKTIVDLASAGGIDGVFIDTKNVIQNTTTFTNSMSYTATEDCVIAFYIVGKNNADGLVKIDNKKVGGFYAGSTVGFSCFYNLKDGQTITVTNAHASYSSDYTVYGIQTGTTHSKFQPVIYSTTEREIGVWTDGKPLYEKTIDFGAIPNSTSKNVAHNISNLDKVVSFDGVMISSDSFETVPSGENSNFRLTATDTNVNVVTSANWNDWSSSFITLRYTKSTDTAGSGTWTPQGVPAVHYSTDEQVIGTWVDGKTLYQKTLIDTTALTGTSKVIDISSLDAEFVQVISCELVEATSNTFSPVTWFNGNINYYAFINSVSNSDITIGYSSEIGINRGTGGYVMTIQYTKSS